MKKDTVLVLDDDDNVIGSASKKLSHQFTSEQPRAILHRAFSVFLFDESTGELLLQQRASTKITFPNVRTCLQIYFPKNNNIFAFDLSSSYHVLYILNTYILRDLLKITLLNLARRTDDIYIYIYIYIYFSVLTFVLLFLFFVLCNYFKIIMMMNEFFNFIFKRFGRTHAVPIHFMGWNLLKLINRKMLRTDLPWVPRMPLFVNLIMNLVSHPNNFQLTTLSS
jgi:hypothetical protein